MVWLGGVEGAFWALSRTRRAQLVAMWRHVNTPQQSAGSPTPPARDIETLESDAFFKRMQDAYRKR